MAKQEVIKASTFSEVGELGQNYDPDFDRDLELLFLRTSLTHTALAAFLGVSYVTYCNWRKGRYKGLNNFAKYAIDVYTLLSDADLMKLVGQRKHLWEKQS